LERVATAPELNDLGVDEEMWGPKVGCIGIGKLREVALGWITETESRLCDERFPVEVLKTPAQELRRRTRHVLRESGSKGKG